ncbi:hypothetical protein CH333_00260 [candidate division WOR-3 bacterium JGI_Cruoil_03_44_89]|uniref:Uncharacterized protein n=1 Tax=candidate division WOR-3 bacterium JGI_Cruoil_03_44_89 TaxID=1973748 RepID=A0A235C1C4_UNCW3|nr:MAG: hypothetical protein CH333_00260 [candidate division WOR-3 bacterium JGI_Cruoil_03_44_89]
MNKKLYIIFLLSIISARAGSDELMSKCKNYNFILTDFGGFEVTVNDFVVSFEQKISYPGGWNCLTIGEPKGEEKDWSVSIKKINEKKFTVTAFGRYYKIVRTIALLDNRICVADRIENRRKDILGCIITNLANPKAKPVSVRLSGNPADSFSEILCCAENPTIFFGFDECGMGLVIEDDIYRLQSKISYGNGVAELKTDQFGLGKDSSYTLCWSIYPLNSNDYYDFVNQLRTDWDVNLKIDGPFNFLSAKTVESMSETQLANLLNSQSIKIIALSPWLNYYETVDGLTKEEFCILMQKAIDKIHKVNPDIKVIGKIHPAMVSLNTQDVPYKDSRTITKNGKHIFSEYYSKIFFKERFNNGWRIYYYYPMTGNSFLKKLQDEVDFCMDSIGTDGIYFDEFSFAFRRDPARYTYDRWDGHTVEIDTITHTVKRKMSDLGFITQDACQKLVDRVISKGGICVANTAPATSTMQKLDVFRFVETSLPETYCRNCPKAHLTTPIGLGYPRYKLPVEMRTDKQIMEDIKAKLDQGLLYYYYGSWNDSKNILNTLFPITPLELHAGFIIGDNKIITNKSGRFGWQDNNIGRVWICDKSGNLFYDKSITFLDTDSINIEIALPRNGIALVEKLPVSLEHNCIPVRILLEEYSNDEITFNLLEGSASKIIIEDERFRIENGKEYSILIDSGNGITMQSSHAHGSTLIFNHNFTEGDRIIIQKVGL